MAKYVRAEQLEESRWRTLSEWLLGILAVLGFLVGLLTLWPRVTVDPSDYYFDPKYPSLVSFRVTNTGIVQLRSVRTLLGLCSLNAGTNDAPVAHKCEGSLKSRLLRDLPEIRKVSMDEKFNYRLDQLINIEGGPIQSADISIIVQFTPWGTWWTVEKEFRFETKREKDGRLSWQPQPLER